MSGGGDGGGGDGGKDCKTAVKGKDNANDNDSDNNSASGGDSDHSDDVDVLVVFGDNGKMHEGDGYCSGAELNDIAETHESTVSIKNSDLVFISVGDKQVIDIRCLAFLEGNLPLRCHGSGYCRSSGTRRVLYAEAVSDDG